MRFSALFFCAALLVPGFFGPPACGSACFQEALAAERAQRPPSARPLALAPHPSSPVGSVGAMTPGRQIHVAPARGANAHRIAELIDQAEILKGQNVQPRGAAVKISRQIMGGNWVHLRGGALSARGEYDLAAYAEDEATRGEIVTVAGVLAQNRDLGAGFVYAAIIENTRVSKK